jgi:hypothetical protein
MANRPDEVLKEASAHLLYEYDMLRETARELDAWQGRLRTDAERVRRNAMVESFVVHVRNLVVFLGWEKPEGKLTKGKKAKGKKRHHPEDVLVKHYVRGFNSEPPDVGWLPELYEVACTRVAHLSYRRANIDPLKRDWPVRDILEAIGRELERFATMAPKNLLDAAWKAEREPVFSEHSSVRPMVPTMTDTTTITSMTVTNLSRLGD